MEIKKQFILMIFFNIFPLILIIEYFPSAYYLFFKETYKTNGVVEVIDNERDKGGPYKVYTIMYENKFKKYNHKLTVRKSEDQFNLKLKGKCILNVSKEKPQYAYYDSSEYTFIIFLLIAILIFDLFNISYMYYNHIYKR